MKSLYKLFKNCNNCSLIILILSVLFFALFMGYAGSLNIENITSERIISCENENIQESDNFEFSKTSNENLPAHNPRIDDLRTDYFISWDLDKEFSTNSEQTKPFCDNLSTKSGLNGLARKYFIIQIISKNILPTQRALRSDVLLI